MNNTAIKNKLDRVIVTAKQAIQVSKEAPDNPTLGYPYACGYSRSALRQIIEELEPIIASLK
jgi:hypothetical protein